MKPLVQRLGYMSVYATDPESVAQDTANNIGARIVGREGDSILMSSNQRHAEYIINKGDSDVHAVCGLEAVSPDAIDEVKRRAQAAGLEVISTR